MAKRCYWFSFTLILWMFPCHRGRWAHKDGLDGLKFALSMILGLFQFQTVLLLSPSLCMCPFKCWGVTSPRPSWILDITPPLLHLCDIQLEHSLDLPSLYADSGTASDHNKTRQSLWFSVLWSSQACQLKICEHLISLRIPDRAFLCLSASPSPVILTDVFLPSLSLPEATPSDPTRTEAGKSKEHVAKEEELYAQYFTFWLTKSQFCQKKKTQTNKGSNGTDS